MDLSQTPGGQSKLPTVAEGKAETQARRTELFRRAQWLRAAVLGAIDGLLSTTSLMLGVGAAKDDRRSMVLSGIAGALAGAFSMAVGEFVSVSTQRDIEQVNLKKRDSVTETEKPEEIKITVTATKHDETGSAEPTGRTPSRSTPCRRMLICEIPEKGSPVMVVEPQSITLFSPTSPALKVLAENAAKAKQEAIDGEEALPNPYKAAAASALAFLCGSLFPLLPAIFVAQQTLRVAIVAAVASIALALFGGIGAHLGGSPVKVSAVRILVGGWIAMGVTYGLLKPFDGDDDAK
ncbi:vacuolar iron transporter homolog 4-like [Rhodamnia argentea]|uniref:Vacuolar iron transporter n=1 Tax=Rhodamnia argentea TaxID=178133 RepID=A0ABM3GXC0_9MYRT|nr:vacuolar iron transporter homolog 4-like [Rhodamnia argentea]